MSVCGRDKQKQTEAEIILRYSFCVLFSYVDYILLMAYNYHGSWNNKTGHHSGLYPRLDERGSEREFNQVCAVVF